MESSQLIGSLKYKYGKKNIWGFFYDLGRFDFHQLHADIHITHLDYRSAA
jgi:hypothetical protein